jgi:hypothetical protein
MAGATWFLKKRWCAVVALAAIVVVDAIAFWYYRTYDKESITIHQNDPRVKSERRHLEGTRHFPATFAGTMVLKLESESWDTDFPRIGRDTQGINPTMRAAFDFGSSGLASRCKKRESIMGSASTLPE